MWNIYRYGSQSVIKVAAARNQKWYSYQKKWYLSHFAGAIKIHMRKYKDTLRDVFFYFSQPTGRAATPLCGEELDRTCERSKASQRPGDGYMIIATDTSRAILGRRCAVTHAKNHAQSNSGQRLRSVPWPCRPSSSPALRCRVYDCSRQGQVCDDDETDDDKLNA